MISITSMTTTILLALSTPAPHGVNEVGEHSLGHPLPLCLQHLKQLLRVSWRGVVVSDSTLQLIPEVFYGIQVRTAGRLVHSVDGSLLHEVLDKQRSMRSGVVILVHRVWPHLLQSR